MYMQLFPPEVGGSNPDKRFSKVVLPAPERPKKASVSPGIISSETSLTATTLDEPEPKTLVRRRAEITGIFPGVIGELSELNCSL